MGCKVDTRYTSVILSFMQDEANVTGFKNLDLTVSGKQKAFVVSVRQMKNT